MSYLGHLTKLPVSFAYYFSVVKYIWHNIYRFTHFKMYILVALSKFIILCNHHHYPFLDFSLSFNRNYQRIKKSNLQYEVF